MKIDAKPAATHLARRGLLSLNDRIGEQIECLAGSLWITQQGDPRDVVLEAGEDFRLDRDGVAVVYALEDAYFALWPAADAAARGSNGSPAAALAASPRERSAP